MPIDEALEGIKAALRAVSALAAGTGARWVVGGSAGLALRGARLASPPRDLDIYADAGAVPLLHERLAAHALDGPAWDDSGIYRSLLAHYRLTGVQVELVGDFEVNAAGSRYRTEVDEFLYACGDDWTIGSDARAGCVRLVPLGHELVFNVLRERHDRTKEVARLMRADPAAHLPQLERLIARQALSADAVGLLRRLTSAAGATEGGERLG